MSRPVQIRGGGNSPAYIVCDHSGCQKKARHLSAEHNCCGKPWHVHLEDRR